MQSVLYNFMERIKNNGESYSKSELKDMIERLREDTLYFPGSIERLSKTLKGMVNPETNQPFTQEDIEEICLDAAWKIQGDQGTKLSFYFSEMTEDDKEGEKQELNLDNVLKYLYRGKEIVIDDPGAIHELVKVMAEQMQAIYEKPGESEFAEFKVAVARKKLVSQIGDIMLHSTGRCNLELIEKFGYKTDTSKEWNSAMGIEARSKIRGIFNAQFGKTYSMEDSIKMFSDKRAFARPYVSSHINSLIAQQLENGGFVITEDGDLEERTLQQKGKSIKLGNTFQDNLRSPNLVEVIIGRIVNNDFRAGDIDNKVKKWNSLENLETIIGENPLLQQLLNIIHIGSSDNINWTQTDSKEYKKAIIKCGILTEVEKIVTEEKERIDKIMERNSKKSENNRQIWDRTVSDSEKIAKDEGIGDK